MPTKPNKAGNQQNYVPAGNGDASGEYGDNATGSNVNWTNFAKPVETESKTSKYENKPKEQSKYKFSSQKGRFKYNNFWDTWDYYTPEEYEKYLRQKATAESYGYKGYEKDQWEDRDVKIIDKEESKKIVDESKKQFEEKVSKMDIYQLNKLSNDDIYKDAIKGVLGEEFTENDKDVFIKQNRDLLKQETQELESLINKRRLEVSKEYIDSNFTKIKGEHSIEDDLAKTNPKYNESGYYHINCQRCSYAYELRRRGYDVEAYPNDDDYGRKKGSFWTRQMKTTESYAFKNSIGAQRLHKKISEKVLAAGDGSRWAIEVQWHRSRSGHLFIVENVGGEVKYFDAQTGSSNVIHYLNNLATSKETTIKRMDNANFDIGVVMTGFSKK